jgi:hypothetical protein
MGGVSVLTTSIDGAASGLTERIESIKHRSDRREAAIELAATLLRSAGRDLDPYHPPVDMTALRWTGSDVAHMQEHPRWAAQMLRAEIRMAGMGDREANRRLRVLAQRYVVSGVTMPEPLAEYACKVLHDKAPRFRRSRGSYYARDYHIAMTVRIIMELGYFPTRNPTQQHDSASSIVSEALGRLNRRISTKRVENIWVAHKCWLEPLGLSEDVLLSKLLDDACRVFSATIPSAAVPD